MTLYLRTNIPTLGATILPLVPVPPRQIRVWATRNPADVEAEIRAWLRAQGAVDARCVVSENDVAVYAYTESDMHRARAHGLWLMAVSGEADRERMDDIHRWTGRAF